MSHFIEILRRSPTPARIPQRRDRQADGSGWPQTVRAADLGHQRSSSWRRPAAPVTRLCAIVALSVSAAIAIYWGAVRASNAAEAAAGAAAQAPQDEPVFRPARAGQGQLRFVNGVPVLTVEGSPAEIGRQQAELIGTAANQLARYPQEFFKRLGEQQQWEAVVERARALAENIPEHHRAEMVAFAEHSGGDRQLGLVANVLPDMYRGAFGCSSLIATAQRSATGKPIFGRNLDFYTLGVLDRYSLVTVYRPTGRNAFASVGFPGLSGVFSGMNEHGLAVAVHEVLLARDGSPMFDPKGVPYSFCFRRILEECRTIEDAEKLLRNTPRTTRLNLAVCDRNTAAVIEMTSKTVALRRDDDGICICTNHFRTKQLETLFICRRYIILSRAKQMEKLSLDDVAKKLDEVNQGPLTLQTMIFEPHQLTLHLAAGSCPSSALPLKTVELKPLLAPTPERDRP